MWLLKIGHHLFDYLNNNMYSVSKITNIHDTNKHRCRSKPDRAIPNTIRRIIRLAEPLLTINRFSFSGNFYKQVNGVAMGTKMGPGYANLFVGFIKNHYSTNLMALNRNFIATSMIALAQHLAADNSLTIYALIIFIQL